MMIQNQSTSTSQFRANNVVARQALLNRPSQSDGADINETTGDATPRKARDTIYCPRCKQNHHVCVGQDQKNQPSLRNWMFDTYVCRNCNQSFSQAGLPIVLPGSVLIGAAILLVAQLIRSQF